jgi:hypothetical protein
MRTTISVSPMFIIFVLTLLKLLDVINISWTWVFCPIWIPMLLFVGILILIVIFGVIHSIIDSL